MILLFKKIVMHNFYYKSLQLQSVELQQLRYVFAILLALTIALAIISKKKKHSFWLLLTIATTLGTSGILVYSLNLYRQHYLLQQKYGYSLVKRDKLDKYQVTLEVPPLQNAKVYLPIPAHANFIKKLKITEGKGFLHLKHTPYGSALEVRFTGKITIKGRIQYADDYFYYAPDLSLVNKEKLEETLNRSRDTFVVEKPRPIPEWLQYSRKLDLRRHLRIYARNLSVPENTPKINFKFSHLHWRGSDTVKFEGQLSSGWQTYKTKLRDIRS